MESSSALDDRDVPFWFCVLSVTAAAPVDYRTEKVRQYLAANGQADVDATSAAFLLMTTPPQTARLADPAAHPEVSEAARRQIDTRAACARRSIDRQTPLLSGETVEREELTFLADAFNGNRAGTAAIRRTTNYGTVLYVFEGVMVADSGRLAFDQPSEPEAPDAALVVAAISVSDVASFIGKNLASGMVSAVGGAIVGLILDKIFPPGVPSYFNEVYDQIKRIVGAELQQTTIDQVNGAINNIKLHVSTEYQPARHGKDLSRLADRQFLFGLLQKYETTYLSGPGGMLGTLMSDKYGKAGFGAFLLGAGLHLALYQEMANVDPSNVDGGGKFRGPLESSYGRPTTGTIATTALYYAAFAEKTWPQMLADRAAKIRHGVSTECIPGINGGAICHDYAWLKDEISPENNQAKSVQRDKDGKAPAIDEMNAAYQTYAAAKAKELTDSLNGPGAITTDWKALVASPIKVA